MGMFEARSRIQSNRSTSYVLSTQDIVSCSEYSQGCEGGKPYVELIYYMNYSNTHLFQKKVVLQKSQTLNPERARFDG
jgi:hypothetical protein